VRNGVNQQASGYNYNVPNHAMSSALVHHQYNQALASDSTVKSIVNKKLHETTNNI
jgi:hypothetical protein